MYIFMRSVVFLGGWSGVNTICLTFFMKCAIMEGWGLEGGGGGVFGVIRGWWTKINDK